MSCDNGGGIDLLHKSHNALIPYSTMHHFATEISTHVHISATKLSIVGYIYLMHFGIFEMDLLYALYTKYTAPNPAQSWVDAAYFIESYSHNESPYLFHPSSLGIHA